MTAEQNEKKNIVAALKKLGNGQSPWSYFSHSGGKTHMDRVCNFFREAVSLAERAAAALEAEESSWKDMAAAPSMRHVLVVSKRFPEVHEAMKYDDGWYTWGTSGVYRDDPIAWRELPAPPADLLSKNEVSAA